MEPCEPMVGVASTEVTFTMSAKGTKGAAGAVELEITLEELGRRLEPEEA